MKSQNKKKVNKSHTHKKVPGSLAGQKKDQAHSRLPQPYLHLPSLMWKISFPPDLKPFGRWRGRRWHDEEAQSRDSAGSRRDWPRPWTLTPGFTQYSFLYQILQEYGKKWGNLQSCCFSYACGLQRRRVKTTVLEEKLTCAEDVHKDFYLQHRQQLQR